jgi:hypothetical protein
MSARQNEREKKDEPTKKKDIKQINRIEQVLF